MYDSLLDALPDLVVLLRRDGVVLDQSGGRALVDLKLGEQSVGEPIEKVWPAAVAALLRQLTRKAIALRTATEAVFDHGGRGYEVRVSPQGPERAVCVIRPTLAQATEDPLEASGGRRRPELDRRGFLRRFRESIALAALREQSAALAVIHIDGVSDIAQLIDAHVGEQVMSAAILRLPPATPGLGEPAWWYVGQLSDSLLAVVLESSDRAALDGCVAMLCASLREPISIGDASFQLSPHAGVAILGRDADSSKTLLQHARAAAAEARRRGSETVCFFSDTVKLRSLARLDIARELRAAIAHGEIRLRYVGRHDLQTGRLVACVGYLRWMHPLRGEVRPTEFLRVAETTGLATALSRAILDCLRQDFATLSPQWEPAVRISFGALRHHILHEDFAGDMVRFLAEEAVPAHRLELRVAEQTFIARRLAILDEMHRVGVRLVVDEVGRGAGSLDALARAPLWGLQLDRAWVGALRGDEVARKVCRAGIGMAAALGLVPIATGVDDEAQREWLLALGCRHGSGDLYQPTVPDLMKRYQVAASD
jgi:EAL domain-containing protein (putative c-di-GMP-specific phosphodiesterase class I)/GGDEF domain-containing protein